MTTYYWLLMASLLLIGSSPIHAQQDWNSLLQRVSQSVKQDGNEGIHLTYTQTVVPHSTREQAQSTTVDIRRQGQREERRTAETLYLTDAEQAYAIYPTAKKIFVLSEWQRAQQALQANSSISSMDELWQGATFKELSAEHANCRRIAIVPTEEMQQVGRVQQLELEFDASSQVLRQAKIYLPEGDVYHYVHFEYTQVRKAKDIGLFQKAERQVFDASGKLLKKYQQFAVEHY